MVRVTSDCCAGITAMHGTFAESSSTADVGGTKTGSLPGKTVRKGVCLRRARTSSVSATANTASNLDRTDVHSVDVSSHARCVGQTLVALIARSSILFG